MAERHDSFTIIPDRGQMVRALCECGWTSQRAYGGRLLTDLWIEHANEVQAPTP